jgi:hypothetical protein
MVPGTISKFAVHDHPFLAARSTSWNVHWKVAGRTTFSRSMASYPIANGALARLSSSNMVWNYFNIQCQIELFFRSSDGHEMTCLPTASM